MFNGFDYLLIFIGGICNICFFIFDIWLIEKRKELNSELDEFRNDLKNIYELANLSVALANRSVDYEENHYDSICNHIQTNREITLDIYDKVNKDE